MSEIRAKKEAYFTKLEELLNEYPSVFVVNVDNVGSSQMQQIRKGLRGQGVVLMGKNTMVRKKLRQMAEENHALSKLLPTVRGNIGFVFTKGDLKDIRAKILENRVQAPAKAGAIAPVDVYVPPGNTGMEPGKTSFFQALGIPTKISRGTIEIVNEVHLIKVGNKVGASEATLLNMLDISPFTYGLSIVNVYDNGTTFHPDVLDIDEHTLLQHFTSGIKNMAALSLALDYPTVASVPHLLVNGFKDLCSISLATDITIPATEKIKEILDNPELLASMQASQAAAPAAAAGGAAESKKEEKVEEPEEEDEEMGFGLFD